MKEKSKYLTVDPDDLKPPHSNNHVKETGAESDFSFDFESDSGRVDDSQGDMIEYDSNCSGNDFDRSNKQLLEESSFDQSRNLG